MRCPYCGANVDGAYCEYCDSKMPVERVEAQTVNGDHVVINNYYYQQSESPQPPLNRSMPLPVDFGSVFTPTGVAVSPKSRLVALLLCLFLGFLGAHRFYAGRYLMGVVYLFTMGLFGFGWFVDILLVLFGRMKDSNGLYLANWS